MKSNLFIINLELEQNFPLKIYKAHLTRLIF